MEQINKIFGSARRRRRTPSACRGASQTLLSWVATMVAILFMVGCGDDTKTVAKHDPTQPVTLTSFEPDSGHISDMMLLDGTNFGSDTSQLKVFFNAKEAAIIGSSGTRILCLVPRLPGDTCVVAIEVAGQRYEYPKNFYYKIGASVTTLVGNGTATEELTKDWNNIQLDPVYIGINADDQLFTTLTTNKLLMLTPKTETFNVVGTEDQGVMHRCAPTDNAKEGWLQAGAEDERDRFVTFDPRELWTPKLRFINGWGRPLNDYAFPDVTASSSSDATHYLLLYNSADGYSYTRYRSGQVVRIDTKTWEARIVGMTPKGLSYGMAFHPIRKTELWMGFNDGGDGGDAKNSICMCDVASTDSTLNFQIMSGPTNGDHRDGPLGSAQFKDIRQINFDTDGNLFVGDCANSCIRMINTMVNPMIVETVIGIPKLQGFKDGTREEAQFNQPHGLVVDSEGIIYISDWGNKRIRRIAVE